MIDIDAKWNSANETLPLVANQPIDNLHGVLNPKEYVLPNEIPRYK